MIRSFRNRGLKRLYERGDPSKVRANQAESVAIIPADLEDAMNPQDLNLPGYRLHPLKGQKKGYWSVWVSANWRITFHFQDGDACDVDLIDYH